MGVRDGRPLLTTSAMAEILGISHRAMRELAGVYLVPCYSLSESMSERYRYRFDEEVVRAFFNRPARMPLRRKAYRQRRARRARRAGR
jgi:hypothetical protein